MLFYIINLFRKLRRIFFLFLISLSSYSYSFEPFVLKNIIINGNFYTHQDYIIKLLPIKFGDVFYENNIKESINKLYETGCFADIKILVSNDVVNINLKENPIINSLDIIGVKSFDSNYFFNLFDEYSLLTGEFLNKSTLDRVVREIKKHYSTKGLNNVYVDYHIKNISDNLVKIDFFVKEPKCSKIKSIEIIGNQNFSKKEILNLFQSTSSGPLTWYTKTDNFIHDKIDNDIDNLKTFYMNLGYMDFSVLSKQINFSKDNSSIYVYIFIKEGQKYKVNDIQLIGNLNGLDKEIRNLINIKTGDTFSLDKLNSISRNIKELLGNYGYAFADVSILTKKEKLDCLTNIIFKVDLGVKTYINKVRIIGNSRTRDIVIRREMKQLESSLYNYKDIKLSKDRIEKLGFFGNVDFKLQQFSNSEDLIDIDVSIIEKPTGIANLSFGYGSSEKSILSASISEDNIFGSGTDLSLQLNKSKAGNNIVISYHDPYFTKNAISNVLSSYYKSNNPVDNNGNYKLRSMGIGANFGLPISDINKVFLGSSFENNKIILYKKSSSIYHRFVNDYGNRTNAIIFNSGWSQDTRDSILTPSCGMYTKLLFDLSTYNLRYLNFSAQHQHYFKIDNIVLALNGMFDYGFSYSNKKYPAIKNIYAGGIGTIRGYYPSSVGPKDLKTGEYLGGSVRMVANAQIYFPFPGGSRDKSLRCFIFSDLGKVFSDKKTIKHHNKSYNNYVYNCGWRSSVGIGLSWQSPLGLMNISYGIPINNSKEDNIQKLQFQIGTGF
ncbi:outer membrane protein [Candidatus Kinetoplastibacterium desouzaii TCC079E]|uniref:Outer membrane protein assembly factor BamA n=1 Tax=Candidatus Kinetoplastidibacterium desouzai TCC079E TaxID=1208919 RepID=M1M3Q7_9PROT|nr:outer membrane protein assembly factor BamA [Candidatus Kinetoplastibacterium desouzaii]AGF46880.1 outer membrane protein [Candidatus Kinetoplastibacterium desouzaii TCC079E]